MTLIERYEQDLEQRVAAGEVTEKPKRTTMYGPSVVLEAVVATLPVGVLEALVHEWGAKGQYGHIIRRLKDLAREQK